MKHNEQKLELDFQTVESAHQISSEILDNTIKGLGFAPNLYSLMANNPALLDAYTHTYNTFRNNSGLNGVEQEVVFLSAATENECHYCVAAHSFVADNMTHVPEEITEAIRNRTEIKDQKLKALSNFTKAMVKERGWISKDQVEEFLNNGYTKNDVLAVITGIGAKTMSNYFNHIMYTPLDDAFKESAWKTNT